MASELFKWLIASVVVGIIVGFVFGCISLFLYFAGIVATAI